MIKILLRDIGASGLTINQTIPKEGIGLSDEEIDLHSPLDIDASVERVGDVVHAKATVQADYGFLCARCLEEMHAVDKRVYDFNFEVNAGDEYVDIGEEIRQELIMANPVKVLCKPDCKGICEKCGTNLNLNQCKCLPKADQPLADK